MTKAAKKENVATKCVSETYEISQGEFKVEVCLTPEYLHIGPKDGFVFRSKNKAETIKRWRTIIGLLVMAVDLIESKKAYGKK